MAEADLEDLAPSLRRVLETEWALGNRVVETGRGWPYGGTSILVLLERPFLGSYAPPPEGLELVEVNDPHYWKAELRCARTGETLACPFAEIP